MAGTYENEYRKFSDIYGINVDIQAYYDELRKRSSTDELKTDNSPKRKEFDIYVDALSNALNEYLYRQTKMEDGKTYDMSNVSLGNFIEDFDNLIKAIHTDEAEAENKEPSYKPYGEASFKEVASAAWAAAKEYHEPLSSIWAENFLKDKISYEEMKDINDKAIENLRNSTPDKIKEQLKDITTLKMAKEAMDKVNKSRDTLWKASFKNWNRRNQELNFAKELEETITIYEKHGFRLPDPVKATLSKPVFDDAVNTLNDYIEAQEILDQETLDDTQTREPVEIYDVEKEREAQTLDSKKQIMEELEKDFGIKTKDSETLLDEMLDRIERVKENDNAHEGTYRDCAMNIFGDAFEAFRDICKLGDKAAAINAQKLTNTVVKNFTKDVFPKEHFERLSDNYVVSREDAFKEVLKERNIAPDRPERFINEVRAEFSKEKVKVDLGNIKNDQKSPMVKEDRHQVRERVID